MVYKAQRKLVISATSQSLIVIQIIWTKFGNMVDKMGNIIILLEIMVDRMRRLVHITWNYGRFVIFFENSKLSFTRHFKTNFTLQITNSITI